MHRNIRFLSLSVLLLALFAFTPPQGSKKTAHFSIEGPFCSGCVGLLERTARMIDGVEEITVDVQERLVRITFDETETTPEAIVKHIGEETTFKLTLKEVVPAETNEAGLNTCR